MKADENFPSIFDFNDLSDELITELAEIFNDNILAENFLAPVALNCGHVLELDTFKKQLNEGQGQCKCSQCKQISNKDQVSEPLEIIRGYNKRALKISNSKEEFLDKQSFRDASVQYYIQHEWDDEEFIELLKEKLKKKYDSNLHISILQNYFERIKSKILQVNFVEAKKNLDKANTFLELNSNDNEKLFKLKTEFEALSQSINFEFNYPSQNFDIALNDPNLRSPEFMLSNEAVKWEESAFSRFNKADYQRALNDFNKAYSIYEDIPLPYDIQEKEKFTAIKNAKQAYIAIRKAVAMCYLQDYKGAIVSLDEAMAKNSNELALCYYHYYCIYTKQDKTKADQFLQLASKYPASYALQTMIRFEKSLPSNLLLLQQVINYDSKNPRLYEFYAKYIFRQHPYKPDITTFSVDSFNRNEHWDTKEKFNIFSLLTLAIGYQPENIRLYLIRGRSYYFTEQHTLAIQDFDAAIRLDPYDANIYYHRAQAKFSKADYEATIQDCIIANKLLVQNNNSSAKHESAPQMSLIIPSSKSSIYNNSQMERKLKEIWLYSLYYLGKYQEAYRLLNEFGLPTSPPEQLNTTQPSYQILLVSILFEMKNNNIKIKGGVGKFRPKKSQYTNNDDEQYYIGLCHLLTSTEKKNSIDEAYKAIDRTYLDQAEFCYHLGMIHIKQNDLERAVKVLQWACEKAPTRILYQTARDNVLQKLPKEGFELLKNEIDKKKAVSNNNNNNAPQEVVNGDTKNNSNPSLAKPPKLNGKQGFNDPLTGYLMFEPVFLHPCKDIMSMATADKLIKQKIACPCCGKVPTNRSEKIIMLDDAICMILSKNPTLLKTCLQRLSDLPHLIKNEKVHDIIVNNIEIYKEVALPYFVKRIEYKISSNKISDANLDFEILQKFYPNAEDREQLTKKIQFYNMPGSIQHEFAILDPDLHENLDSDATSQESAALENFCNWKLLDAISAYDAAFKCYEDLYSFYQGNDKNLSDKVLKKFDYILLRKSVIHFYQEDYIKAISCIDIVEKRQLSKEMALLYYLKARICIAQNNKEQAQIALEAVYKHPAGKALQLMTKYYLNSIGKNVWQISYDTLTEAASVDTANADIFNKLAFLMCTPENKQHAITFFKRAIEAQPKQPYAYYYLGNIYARSGSKDAEAEYTKSISFATQDAGFLKKVCLKRANVRFVLGNIEGAYLDFTQVVDSHNSQTALNSEEIKRYLYTLFYTDNHQQFIHVCQEQLQKNPKDAFVYGNSELTCLFIYAAKLQNYSFPIDLATIEPAQSSNIYLYFALKLFNEKQYQKACDHLTGAMAVNCNGLHYYFRALSYLKLGNIPNAKNDLMRLKNVPTFASRPIFLALEKDIEAAATKSPSTASSSFTLFPPPKQNEELNNNGKNKKPDDEEDLNQNKKQKSL